MDGILEKVTAVIIQSSAGVDRLLLLRHPFAGLQIPAGTVNPGETPRQAVLREAREETGLEELELGSLLGQLEEELPSEQAVVLQRSTAYARPDIGSFDWAILPRGARVMILRRQDGFTQVQYLEYDKVPEPQYVTYNITGWVPDQVLGNRSRRFFYRLSCIQPTPEAWTTVADHHTFALSWYPLESLPDLIPPQNAWRQFIARAVEDCS